MTMKRTAFAIVALAAVALFARADKPTAFEYATIRWDGIDNSQIILPSAKVQFVGKQLHALKRPDRTDERAFYQNVMMNSLGADGYEFAGFSADQNQIVMKRRSN